MDRAFARVKGWNVFDEGVCPTTGAPVLALCQLWRFRATPDAGWVLEARLPFADGPSAWRPCPDPAGFPAFHLWPFVRREETRAKELRWAVAFRLAHLAWPRVRHRWGAPALTAKQLSMVCGVMVDRWSAGVFRDQRVLAGLRCFFKGLWKGPLAGRLGPLCAIRGFSAGVSMHQAIEYLQNEPAFRRWEATPAWRPLLMWVFGHRHADAPLIQSLSPDTVREWLRKDPRAFPSPWEHKGFGSPLPACETAGEVDRLLASPPSLLRAAMRHYPCNGRARTAYWRLPASLLDQLETLPLRERAALVESLTGSRANRSWRPFVASLVERYLQSRRRTALAEGCWPRDTAARHRDRLKATLEAAWQPFLSPPRSPPLAWSSFLPRDHPWRVEDRRDALERAFPPSPETAPTRRL